MGRMKNQKHTYVFNDIDIQWPFISLHSEGGSFFLSHGDVADFRIKVPQHRWFHAIWHRSIAATGSVKISSGRLERRSSGNVPRTLPGMWRTHAQDVILFLRVLNWDSIVLHMIHMGGAKKGCSTPIGDLFNLYRWSYALDFTLRAVFSLRRRLKRCSPLSTSIERGVAGASSLPVVRLQTRFWARGTDRGSHRSSLNMMDNMKTLTENVRRRKMEDRRLVLAAKSFLPGFGAEQGSLHQSSLITEKVN